MKLYDVAIIGAGLTGCSLANLLTQQGKSCLLIEKSRGFGGRCSRRLLKDGLSIDIGAPFFEKEAQGHPLVEHWCKQGLLESHTVKRRSFGSDKESNMQIFIPKKSMNSLHKDLAGEIDFVRSTRVHELKKDKNWALFDEDTQAICQSKAVIVTAPAEQTLALMSLHTPETWQPIVEQVALSSQAIWVSLIKLHEDTGINTNLIEGGHPDLQHAYQITKGTWRLQATPAWSKVHVETSPDKANHLMGSAFQTWLGSQAPIEILTTHLWRLGGHDVIGTNGNCLWHEQKKLGIAADWLAGGGLMASIKSAEAISKKILNS